MVITLLHVGGCTWMLLLNPCVEVDGVFVNDQMCSQDNVNNLYAESFHLSATMMLGVSNNHIIGDSSTLDLLTERRESDRALIYTVSTFYMIGGLFMVALLISELNVFLFGKMQGSAAFQRKIDRVKHEMEYYAVPDELQLQVKAFYDYIWIHQKQYDDRIALLSDDQMSTDLQRKLALHLFKDVVSHISIFSEIDDLLLGEICLSLRTRIFLPGDMVLFKGDAGKELFIIAKGVVEVLRDDLPPAQRQLSPPIFLKNGSFFGEIALIMETRRTCSVQARTVCEVNILQQSTFDTILRENPDFAMRMKELVVTRQLERSLSKTAGDGVDFQVSKDDMDAAISVLGKNMKKGLDRRMREDSLPHSTRKTCSSYEQGQGAKRSTLDATEGSDRQKHGPGQLRNVAHRIRSSFRHPTSHNRVDEVTQIIDDIARRSTRFQNVPRPRSDTIPTHSTRVLDPSTRNRSLSDSIGDSSSMDVSSNSELIPLKIIKPSMYNDEGRCSFTIVDGEGEDTETMLVTGHYNPYRVKVDISKVLPSILNSGDHSPTLSRLEIQLVQQGQMLQQLISTVEILNQGAKAKMGDHEEEHTKNAE